MDITFIRHGHGEHLKDYPNQLNCQHPGLTELGKSQVIALRKQVVFATEDVILVSPTKRTIETSQLLAGNRAEIRLSFHMMVRYRTTGYYSEKKG